MFKRTILFLFVFAFLGLAHLNALDFITVDIEVVFNEYQRTIDEEAELTREGEEKQRELEAKMREVEELREELDLLSERERETKQSELDRKMQELRQFDQRVRTDLSRRRDMVIRDILEEIDQAIQEYAQSEGHDIIFNSRALLFKQDGIDKTEDVIEFLNQRYEKGAGR